MAKKKTKKKTKKQVKTPERSTLGGLVRGVMGGLHHAHTDGNFSDDAVLANMRVRLESALAEGGDMLTELAEARVTRASEMREVLERRSKRVQAYATRLRKTVPPVKGSIVIAGCVQDQATDLGLSGLTVAAAGPDGEELGTSGTDALGYFRLQWQPGDLPQADELAITFTITDAEGSEVHQSRHTFSAAPGTAEFVCLSVDGQDVEENVVTAARVRKAVEDEVARLDRRAGLLVTDASRDPLLRSANRVVPSRADGSPPEKPQKKKTKDDTTGPPPSLESVNGIAESFAATLREAGVKDARELTKVKAKKLAEVLEISPTRAKAILSAARERLKSDEKK